MYGLINSALRMMMCEQYGQEIWDDIMAHAQLSEEHFFVMKFYPDDITHNIVQAATTILDISATDLLRKFGHYWVGYTKTAGYQEIMDMCGDNLVDFLGNLDDLHTRLGVQFPSFRPPSFDCDQVGHQTVELHYRSTRQGLGPMVEGLIEGLGDRFDTEVEITQIADRAQGDECDTFLIHYTTD
jgi:hypothetical protein